MPRKIKVITTCFHEEYRQNVTPEQNLEKVKEMLSSFKNTKPDVVCFPEVVLETGVNSRDNMRDTSGMLFEVLSQKARELGSYIITGAHEYIDGNLRNSAWLIDRNGNLAGRYIKHYPTLIEMDYGVKPGSEIPVFETDFGTIGMLICFDIDWPQVWETLESKGAEIVFWVSAFDGGFTLQTYAALHFYPVVSSVSGINSKIIDKTGRVLTTTSKWMNWTSAQLDLDKTVFHIDYCFDKVYEIKRALGNKVILDILHEENRFTLESNDVEWPVERIKKEFGLEDFKEYHKRSEVVQDKLRIK